jgi:hypothetical protein
MVQYLVESTRLIDYQGSKFPLIRYSEYTKTPDGIVNFMIQNSTGSSTILYSGQILPSCCSTYITRVEDFIVS